MFSVCFFIEGPKADEVVDGGFFVFPDISVKIEGTFRLRFSLFEMIKWVALSSSGKIRLITRLSGTLSPKLYTSDQ